MLVKRKYKEGTLWWKRYSIGELLSIVGSKHKPGVAIECETCKYALNCARGSFSRFCGIIQSRFKCYKYLPE